MKRDYLTVCLTLMIWGSLYVVSKYAFMAIPPVTVLLCRNLIGVVPLFYLARKKGLQKVEKNHIPIFVLFGLCGYTMAVGFQLLSTSFMDASIASLINSVNPLFTTFFAVFLLREKVTLNKLLGVAISVLGVSYILGVGGANANIPGVICSVISVVLWSLTSVGIRVMSRHYSSQQITFLGILCAIPFSACGAVWELQLKPIHFSALSVAAVFYMGLFCTGLANYLWAKSLQKLDASVCTMFYPLQPLFASMLGILLLHEQITWKFVIGGILVSIGVVCGVYQKRTIND